MGNRKAFLRFETALWSLDLLVAVDGSLCIDISKSSFSQKSCFANFSIMTFLRDHTMDSFHEGKRFLIRVISDRPENSEAKNLRSNSFEQRTVFRSGYLRKRATRRQITNYEALARTTSRRSLRMPSKSFMVRRSSNMSQ